MTTGTNRSFRHAEETSLTAAELWAHWMDVSNWGSWDLGLDRATADGPIALGSTGTIFPRRGRPAPFTVIEFDEGSRYAFETSLPGAKLVVRRLIVSTEPTTFAHQVSFEGMAAPVWAALLGGGFRKVLPDAMKRLAELPNQSNSGTSTM